MINAHPQTPSEAWAEMRAGNVRFVSGSPEHPRQDSDFRALSARGQRPIAALFGCSDSRLAAEIIFDVGLGDLFVVRNAGQVVDATVIGSLEYAVEVLGVSLIVVLGHDHCGAVAAAIDERTGKTTIESGYLAELVHLISPALDEVEPIFDGSYDAREVGKHHLARMLGQLSERSTILRAAVESGRLALVSANYELANGTVQPHEVIGSIAPDVVRPARAAAGAAEAKAS